MAKETTRSRREVSRASSPDSPAQAIARQNVARHTTVLQEEVARLKNLLAGLQALPHAFSEQIIAACKSSHTCIVVNPFGTKSNFRDNPFRITVAQYRDSYAKDPLITSTSVNWVIEPRKWLDDVRGTNVLDITTPSPDVDALLPRELMMAATVIRPLLTGSMRLFISDRRDCSNFDRVLEVHW